MTAYFAKLGSHQEIYIDNRGAQTQINLKTGGPGQQQQQGTGLSTGVWKAAPKLYRTPTAFIIHIRGEQGDTYVHISGGSIAASSDASALKEAQEQPLTPVDERPSIIPEMAPMPPMNMKMGDMEMTMGGEMTMGNMTMGSNQPATPPTEETPPVVTSSSSSATATPSHNKQFCTQCGNAVSTEDRFCGNCGHKLA